MGKKLTVSKTLAVDGEIAKAIAHLYAITGELEDRYPGRHFTPDGHMVGSIGEVVAAEAYGLRLFEASHPAHDAKAPDGRLVQIKATQGKRIAISERLDYLIVLHIHHDGTFEEIYNGPGNAVWKQFEGRKVPKNGQYQISLAKLRKLDAEVHGGDRIPVVG